MFAEKQKGRVELRSRVHQGGTGFNASQPRGGAHHQPERIRRVLLLQSGLWETQHFPFQEHRKALGDKLKEKTQPSPPHGLAATYYYFKAHV